MGKNTISWILCNNLVYIVWIRHRVYVDDSALDLVLQAQRLTVEPADAIWWPAVALWPRVGHVWTVWRWLRHMSYRHPQDARRHGGRTGTRYSVFFFIHCVRMSATSCYWNIIMTVLNHTLVPLYNNHNTNVTIPSILHSSGRYLHSAIRNTKMEPNVPWNWSIWLKDLPTDMTTSSRWPTPHKVCVLWVRMQSVSTKHWSKPM